MNKDSIIWEPYQDNGMAESYVEIPRNQSREIFSFASDITEAIRKIREAGEVPHTIIMPCGTFHIIKYRRRVCGTARMKKRTRFYNRRISREAFALNYPSSNQDGMIPEIKLLTAADKSA
jgi:hypothetical protein